MRYAFQVTEVGRWSTWTTAAEELFAAIALQTSPPCGRCSIPAEIYRTTAAKMFSISEDEVTDEQRRQAKRRHLAPFLSSPSRLIGYFNPRASASRSKKAPTF